jgi:polyhydroxyalkanoate synthesis regulator phasin
MKSMSILAVALATAFSLPAFSQTTSTPRIDQRQEKQQQRIDQGVKSGQLNEKEAARLQKGQVRVQKMEDKAAADGKVTAKERRRIEHTQDQQSRRIARQRHDKQKAK